MVDLVHVIEQPFTALGRDFFNPSETVPAELATVSIHHKMALLQCWNQIKWAIIKPDAPLIMRVSVAVLCGKYIVAFLKLLHHIPLPISAAVRVITLRVAVAGLSVMYSAGDIVFASVWHCAKWC